MEWKTVAKPALREDMSTAEKLRLVLEYAYALEKQLKYVLGNLDTGNFNRTVSAQMKSAGTLAEAAQRSVKSGDAASYVEQTAAQLAARVEKRGVVAAVNMSPEEIKIAAAKIALEGLTTINGAFKVLLDGSFEATGGKIGGWSVGEHALYTGENTEENVPELYMGTADLAGKASIAGSGAKRDWRMKVGGSFGVDAQGRIYAEGGVFRGTVSAGSIVGGAAATGEDYGKMDGGAIADGTVTERQMEAAYRTMKEQMDGMQLVETTIGGVQVYVLAKEA